MHRRGIENLIEKLARLQTTEDKPLEVALTTNAVLLGRKARALKDAGVERVPVSLDAVSDATFRRMGRLHQFLLLLATLTVFGAVAGAHGFLFF